jgi:hypothetical protein
LECGGLPPLFRRPRGKLGQETEETGYSQGAISATRFDLDHWMKTLPQPWTAARCD